MKKPVFGANGVLTKEEAADLLSTSVRGIERRIEAKEFEARRDKRRVVIDRNSFDQYMANLPTLEEAPCPLPTKSGRSKQPA